MAVTRTGSVYSSSSNNTSVSISVTVPADADICIVHVSNIVTQLDKLNWDDTAPNDFTLIEEIGTDSATSELWYMDKNDANWPGSGSHTLYRDNDSTTNYGCFVVVLFYKNVDLTTGPIRTSGAQQVNNTNQDPFNTAVDSPGSVEAGDMTIYGVNSADFSGDMDINSQTVLFEDTAGSNTVWCCVAEKLGETTMDCDGRVDYPRGTVVTLYDVGSATYTKTFTGAGYLQAQGKTKTVTGAGYLQAGKTLTHTAAGYLVKQYTKAFTAASYLQKTNSLTFTAAGYLQGLSSTLTFTAAGYLQALGRTKTFTGAAYLQEPGKIKTFTGAAYLKGAKTVTFTAAGYLEEAGGGGTYNVTFTAAAYLKSLGVEKTFTSAGYLQEQGKTKAFTAASYLSPGTEYIAASNEDNPSAWATVTAGSQRGFVLYVFARGDNQNNANIQSATLDGVSGVKADDIGYTVSPSFHKVSAFYWLDGNMPTNTGQYPISATVVSGSSNDVIMIWKQIGPVEQQVNEASAFRKGESVTTQFTPITTITDDAIVVDGILHRVGGATLTASDPAGREVQNDITTGDLSAAVGSYTQASAGAVTPDWSSDGAANTMLSLAVAFAPSSVATYAKLFFAAGYLQGLHTRTFTSAGYLQRARSRLFTAAGYLAKVTTATFTSAGYVKQTGNTLSFTAAAHIIDGTLLQFTAAAYLKAKYTKDFITAGYLRKQNTKAFTAAGYLTEFAGNLKVFDAAGWLVNRNTLTFTAAGYLFRGVKFNAAGYLKKTQSASFTAAGYVRQRPGQWDTTEIEPLTWTKR